MSSLARPSPFAAPSAGPAVESAPTSSRVSPVVRRLTELLDDRYIHRRNLELLEEELATAA